MSDRFNQKLFSAGHRRLSGPSSRIISRPMTAGSAASFVRQNISLMRTTGVPTSVGSNWRPGAGGDAQEGQESRCDVVRAQTLRGSEPGQRQVRPVEGFKRGQRSRAFAPGLESGKSHRSSNCRRLIDRSLAERHERIGIREGRRRQEVRHPPLRRSGHPCPKSATARPRP